MSLCRLKKPYFGRLETPVNLPPITCCRRGVMFRSWFWMGRLFFLTFDDLPESAVSISDRDRVRSVVFEYRLSETLSFLVDLDVIKFAAMIVRFKILRLSLKTRASFRAFRSASVLPYLVIIVADDKNINVAQSIPDLFA